MLSERDKTIIGLISQDIPLEKAPFRRLAFEAGIGERALLEKIQSYKENGYLRKFSAILNHKKIGFLHNAMVVWNIPDELLDRSGNLMANFTQVSHCYQRKRAPGWEYNLYSMIHGRSRKECLSLIRRISEKTGCQNYKILFSSNEYKKSAARYFSDKQG